MWLCTTLKVPVWTQLLRLSCQTCQYFIPDRSGFRMTRIRTDWTQMYLVLFCSFIHDAHSVLGWHIYFGSGWIAAALSQISFWYDNALKLLECQYDVRNNRGGSQTVTTMATKTSTCHQQRGPTEIFRLVLSKWRAPNVQSTKQMQMWSDSLKWSDLRKIVLLFTNVIHVVEENHIYWFSVGFDNISLYMVDQLWLCTQLIRFI